MISTGPHNLEQPGGLCKDSGTSALAATEVVYFSQKRTPISDSLRVAAGYERRHDTILRAIDNLTCETEFRHHNFAEATYLDAQGKPRRCVLMTKAGFLLLALGFTGKKAASYKISFIRQFEQLEAQLAGKSYLVPTPPLPRFMERATQIASVKQTAYHLLHSKAGKHGLIQYHRGVMRVLVGKTPAEYVQEAVAAGLRVASYSGRELLRRLDPPRAATAAFLDDQLRRGQSLEQLTDAGVPQALTEAFAAMLRAGITVPELQAA
jgi:Rha family phage regulatory protein